MPPEEEPFYGLEDFLRDVDKEWSARPRRRKQEEKKKKDGRVEVVGTIWDELEDLGAEFVEFLEQQVEEAEEELLQQMEEGDSHVLKRTEEEQLPQHGAVGSP